MSRGHRRGRRGRAAGRRPRSSQIEVGLLQNFCEILYCPETRAAAIVDPAWEVDRLLREAERLGLKIELALITHTHERPHRGRRRAGARRRARRWS